MKILLAARLSRLGDASTGIEKQDEQAQRYASDRGHEIVGTAEDSDVSGSTDPFKRQGLGPWLTDPDKISEYEGIIAANFARLGRNARHLARLRAWCEDNGKKLITAEPDIDWSSDIGQVTFGIMSWLAEQELKAITRRAEATRKYLIDNENLVSRAPFGFRIVPKGKHKTLEPDDPPEDDRDPERIYTAPIVREMAERYLARESLSEICAWLDSEDIKPPQWAGWAKKSVKERGQEPAWSHKSVSQILRNPALAGRQMEKDEKNKPKSQRDPTKIRRTLLRIPPILEPDVWHRLQEALDANARRKGIPSGETAMLTGILCCGKCSRPMYRIHARRVGAAYYCRRPRGGQSCKNLIKVTEIDALVSNTITEAYGWLPHMERKLIRGDNHAEEIAELEQDIRELNLDDPEFDEKLRALRAERSRLKAHGGKPDRIEKRETGQTIAEYWSGLDDEDRREYLLERGVKYFAHRDEDGELFVGEGDPESFMAGKGEMFRDISKLGGPTVGEMFGPLIKLREHPPQSSTQAP